MRDFLQGLFGQKGPAGNRTVAGTPVPINVKEAAYIRDSKQRLSALQALQGRYKGTPYAQKIKDVHDKTERIHTYLAERSRAYELELFHLQHTDHFLNTFTVILDVHRQQVRSTRSATARADAVIRRMVSGPFRKERKEVKEARRQNLETSERVLADIAGSITNVPRLTVPEISINTYTKLIYLREDAPDSLIPHKIGFTSSPEEKEMFVSYVADRLGLEDITYIGNALVAIPIHQPAQPPEMVPVIHWNGSPYVLMLDDHRLFPVSTFRKQQ
ncbi:hypothetical protein [Pontibacter liquoris]|uniref:hypothetical protein n=1 Tax=Pontibacter liquoris TaxID=2905677 RepID=UPI001FA7064C|nr:hypothetical protein [Pontibacter liquoris]